MKDQTMPSDFTDETLMAFADGHLDEPLFSALAEALETDPDLAARLEALVTGSALARRGFEPLLAPVPPALEASVRATIARSARPAFDLRRWSNWLYPLGGLAAAALVVVAVAPSLLPASPAIGQLASAEVAATLNTLPSGASATLADGLVISPVATFTDQVGTLCREFETTGSASYHAVSCRDGSGWAVRLAMSTTAGDGLYSPASGAETLDAYLQSIGAGAPLLDGAEAEALSALPR